MRSAARSIKEVIDMAKEILFNEDARRALGRGVERIGKCSKSYVGT